MNRRPLALLAALSAVATFAPAPAAWATTTSTVVVDGDNFGAHNLSVVSRSCTDITLRTEERPELRVVRGPLDPPHGNYSIGWVASAEDGFGIGPTAPVAKTLDLAGYSATVYSPNSYANWVAVATFEQPNRPGIWMGATALTGDTGTGWHEIGVNSYETTYSWRHFDASGALDEAAPDKQTLANMVNGRALSDVGARVGFLVGCDGDSVFIDALSLHTETSSTDNTKVYDFEGYQTRTALSANKKTVAKGTKVTLRAQLALATSKDALDGTVLIEQRKQGSSGFTTLTSVNTGSDGVATLTAKPTKTTTYRATYAGGNTTDSSSATITIKVKKKK